MKLYRSLIYREFKLTRKRFLLMLILFLLLSILMMTPLMLGIYSEPADPDDDLQGLVFVLDVFAALAGGIMAGTNNGVQKADISSGWKRYSFILPPTAKQQALCDLLTKLCYVLLFGLLSMAFAWLYTLAADYSTFGIMLSVYFIVVSAVMLVDVAYSYIIMFANDNNQLKLVKFLAFIGAGVILKVFGLFPGFKSHERPAEGGALISDKAFDRFFMALGSGKTIACVLAAFAVVCVLYFLVMWRSHERREP